MRSTHYAVIASMLVCAAACTPYQRAQRHYQRQNYTAAARVLDGGRLSGDANRLFRSAHAHIELANANAALAAGDYGRAAADYRRALWFGPIEPSAKSAALRGRCLAELHGESLRTAAAACDDFRKDSPTHPDLGRVQEQLAQGALAAAEHALDEGNAEDARGALSIYDSLPGAHRADELTSRVGVLEARAEQLRNEIEQARVREAHAKDAALGGWILMLPPLGADPTDPGAHHVDADAPLASWIRTVEAVSREGCVLEQKRRTARAGALLYDAQTLSWNQLRNGQRGTADHRRLIARAEASLRQALNARCVSFAGLSEHGVQSDVSAGPEAPPLPPTASSPGPDGPGDGLSAAPPAITEFGLTWLFPPLLRGRTSEFYWLQTEGESLRTVSSVVVSATKDRVTTLTIKSCLGTSGQLVDICGATTWEISRDSGSVYLVRQRSNFLGTTEESTTRQHLYTLPLRAGDSWQELGWEGERTMHRVQGLQRVTLPNGKSYDALAVEVTLPSGATTLDYYAEGEGFIGTRARDVEGQVVWAKALTQSFFVQP